MEKGGMMRLEPAAPRRTLNPSKLPQARAIRCLRTPIAKSRLSRAPEQRPRPARHRRPADRSGITMQLKLSGFFPPPPHESKSDQTAAEER